MASAVAELYAPLIERDLPAIPAAVRKFGRAQGLDDLFTAIARFGVLAFAPTQHAKHAFLAVAAAHELRDEAGDRWESLLCECASYLAQSRLPWSEPPILDPPPLVTGQRVDTDELRQAIAARDRLRGERWLAGRMNDPDLAKDLFDVASSDNEDLGHKLIITVAASKLAAVLGEKGRFAALRVAVWEIVSYSGSQPVSRGEDLHQLIQRCVDEKGSIESAHAVFLFDALREAEKWGAGADLSAALPRGTPVRTLRLGSGQAPAPHLTVPVYRLARDYAACLKAHAVAKRLRSQFPDAPADDFVAACQYNLDHAASFEDWSFA